MRIVNGYLFPGVLLVLLSTAGAAFGQEEAPPPEEERPSARTAVGDVLHLKSGATMTGVQIVKSMPRYYEVQLVEGVEPLRIPRNQVLSVEFDDYDPSRERLRRELFPDSEEVSLASGERVSRHLMDKLMAPVSEDSLSYDKKDLIRVLEETADRLDVKIKIHPSIRNTPANRRRWTIETTEGTTLMTLLREDLVSEFDFVEVLFENDTVVVMTKKAATSRKTKVEGSGE